MLLYNIGPDKLKFLPIEPKGVEMITPSPQILAKCINYFPSILAYSLSFRTLFRISRRTSSSHEKLVLGMQLFL